MVLRKSLSQREQLHFAQQLSTLMQAGLDLLHAITLIKETAPQHWHRWLTQTQLGLKAGSSFSHCLRQQKSLFSPEFLNLLQVGERTGNLDLALKTICEQLEAQIELGRKVQQVLTYPLITLVSSFILIIMMMIWVVPVFADVFSQFQAELPGPTRGLIQASSFFQSFFFEVCATLLFCAIAFIVSWTKSASLQKQCDFLAFRIPILGQLLKLAALTYWCRTLGHLISSGLSLPDALRITAHSSNQWISHDFSAQVFKYLAQGWPLGESLARADPKHILLDIETWHLLRMASENGALPAMLQKRATILGADLSNRLNSLSQSLEPLLIIFVGIIIGGLVIILYLPIFHLGHIV